MPTEQRSHLLRNLVAVESGKTDVDQHNVWTARPGHLDAQGPVLGHVDTMPVHLQSDSKHLTRIRIVLDHENVARATDIGRTLFPPSEAELIAELIRRDLPYYDPSIWRDFVAGMNQFSRDVGILSGDVPYEDVVATQFSHLWTG